MKSQNEIDRVRNWAAEGMDEGSKYPGMSYENGIADVLDWLAGDLEEAPDEQ